MNIQCLHKLQLGLALCACLSGSLLNAAEVNVYSARKEGLIKPLLQKFEEQTGTPVNLITGKADTLLQRIISEGVHSPADVLITIDAGRLYRAQQANVLQPIESAVLTNSVPKQYRDPNGYWFGLSVRARPIMYDLNRVRPEDLSTYERLGHPVWQKKICIRSSDNIYNQSLVASMLAHLGKESTLAWAKGLVDNFARPPQGGDRDQIRAVAAGQCDVAVANSYYLGKMLASKDPAQREAAEKVRIFWPNQENRGVHVNISGGAVTRFSKNKAHAIALLEFLVSDAAQQWYAETNFEYPVKPAIPASEILSTWGKFKADSLNLHLLGELNAKAVMIMDHAKWK
ncbi:MAG: Fe(3+) ABC transporter substrate-binding protein [Gammaproteobacteria bacterium]|nr:Fe(3+) ABC transporter substrate-binding protein [Gammaproteobacteria bacterium]